MHLSHHVHDNVVQRQVTPNDRKGDDDETQEKAGHRPATFGRLVSELSVCTTSDFDMVMWLLMASHMNRKLTYD